MKVNERIKNMKVLVVEDHAGLSELLVEEISEAGFKTRRVGSAEEAVKLLAHWGPDLVISDLRLPGADGLALLEEVKTRHLPASFLMITAFGTVNQAVEALKAGADDFLTKPLDLDHLFHRIHRILETRRLREEVRRFQESIDEDTFEGIYGASRGMRVLFDQIKRTAAADGPVLVLGESGSGKELVARALHACSPRKDQPFLAVNCAGIPEALMESEFFGHEAGAFTGAGDARTGLFREAKGGTLFLDEIAEMPLSLQAKLLRILQDGKVRPVGAHHEEQVDVRIVAATHRDLEAAVREGDLREDLFYRLETFTLNVPPLRERGDDIDFLASRFLVMFNTRMGKSVQGFTPAAMERLRGHAYPGNVRELRNAVERAVTFCDAARIRPEHLPTRIRDGGRPEGISTSPVPLASLFSGEQLPTLAEVEQRYLRHVLEQVDGNKKKAAEILGITRNTLYRRIGET